MMLLLLAQMKIFGSKKDRQKRESWNLKIHDRYPLKQYVTV